MNRRMLTMWLVAGAAMVTLVPDGAEAQGRGRGGNGKIPPGHLPPAGQCRVWYDDRPPGHQPAPTDCATARREAGRTGARVVYGGGNRRDDRYDRNDRYEDRDGRWETRDPRDRDCIDRDRDGRCDFGETTRYPDRYPDQNPDRYPDRAGYPSSLPETVWGVIYGRGDRRALSGVRQWLGTGDVRARYTDANRDGRPEQVTWSDARGTILQRWIDETRDGRADRVVVYRNGRIVRVIQ